MASSEPFASGGSMPKRPGDVIGAAVMVGKIATGEIADNAKADKPASIA